MPQCALHRRGLSSSASRTERVPGSLSVSSVCLFRYHLDVWHHLELPGKGASVKGCLHWAGMWGCLSALGWPVGPSVRLNQVSWCGKIRPTVWHHSRGRKSWPVENWGSRVEHQLACQHTCNAGVSSVWCNYCSMLLPLRLSYSNRP